MAWAGRGGGRPCWYRAGKGGNEGREREYWDQSFFHYRAVVTLQRLKMCSIGKSTPKLVHYLEVNSV